MFLSSGARALGLPVTALAAALTTFLIVDSRGAAAYGYVMLVGLLFQLIPFADLGMGAAVTTTVALSGRGERDQERADNTIRAAFWLLVASGCVVVLLALVLSVGGVWGHLLQLPTELVEEAQWSLLITFVPFAVSLPLGIGQRILLGLGKNHYVNLISVGGPLVALGATWLLLHASAPSLYLAVATPLGVLTVSALCFFVAARNYQRPVRGLLNLSRIQRRTVLEVWHSAGPMLVISIAVPIALQSDRLVLAWVSNGHELASYSVGAQFYTPTFSLISTAAVALWPIFARETTNALRQWRRALLVLVGIGAVAGGLYVLLIRPVASLVTKSEVPVELPLAVAFGALVLIMAAHQPSAMMLTTPAGLRFQAICVVLMLLLNLPLSVYLASVMGAPGPIWASVISAALVQLLPIGLRAADYARKRAESTE
ncbi:lipopolysaccharide biosynthesis protein [Curtobacterium sp. MCLR17_034]|uniref:lipopolysaccharide biosynthesis protein n=1 Tax=Curtobacterium sp. MCLR17_034 TaxID=2175623 RepID=UPI000DAA5D4C|nr:oligosaccharide flippase family protein [Curtobacterium sp. MCLR17_034]PZF13060.1 hypothetical protein DEI98_03395 [Curtobacterium sp. MCLR17_034]